MKNLLLAILLISIASCTTKSPAPEKAAPPKEKVTEPIKIKFENEQIELNIDIDKSKGNKAFGKAQLKNKTSEAITINTSDFLSENNGIPGSITFSLTDAMTIENSENMTAEELKNQHSKNRHKRLPLQEINLQPNAEKSLFTKFTFSRPIGDPQQTIIKMNSPSNK